MIDTKADNIKEELKKILDIVYQAQESKKILNFLWTDSGDEEINYEKRMNFFFAYCKGVFYKDTVIALSKLFHESRNEHFNLSKFINKLDSDKDYNGLIPLNTLNEWRQLIIDANDIITNVKENRARYAAHTDRTFNPENYPLTLKDFEDLVIIAQKIAKDIHWILDQSSFLIDSPIGSPVDSLKHILNVIAGKKKDSLRPLLYEAEKYDLQDEIPEWFKRERNSNA